MKLESNLKHHVFVLHTAPLLDVVLLLLVFFLMGSSFVLKSGIAVDLPFSSSTLPPVESSHIITATGGSSPQIYFNDSRIALADLDAVLEDQSGGVEHVILKADKLTAYGVVMEISDTVLRHGYELSHASSSQRPTP